MEPSYALKTRHDRSSECKSTPRKGPADKSGDWCPARGNGGSLTKSGNEIIEAEQEGDCNKCSRESPAPNAGDQTGEGGYGSQEEDQAGVARGAHEGMQRGSEYHGYRITQCKCDNQSTLDCSRNT